ncbi:MAG: DUF4337 domain-containing protein [Gemmatimonadota bacterium]|nr:DUF4337 domain-containing protein [Gemmatimonadota bacterium]
MPEGPEVDLDSIQERVNEEVERETSGFIRVVALTTALLAALAAISSLQAGATVNEALLLKTESTQLQSRASDQWAYYQAKGIKEAVTRSSANAWTVAGKPVPATLQAAADKYASQQAEITIEARKLEHERDLRSAEAEHLLHRHHGFANAVALFQVAIALGAITALTRSRPVFLGAIGLGVAGLVLFALEFTG